MNDTSFTETNLFWYRVELKVRVWLRKFAGLGYLVVMRRKEETS